MLFDLILQLLYAFNKNGFIYLFNHKEITIKKIKEKNNKRLFTFLSEQLLTDMV